MTGAGALIGRHGELQQVVEAFKAARGGEATTVVIRGEPGIGKSRFLAEALAQAELLGHGFCFGRLDDLDRYVPYAAFRSSLLTALDGERDPELVPIAIAVHDGLVAAAAAGSAAEALPLPRLVAALEGIMRAWSEREPLVLAIDDLHAADADTLTVLSLLIRKLQTDAVTFIATMRVHPPDVSIELAATIDRLGRDGLASVIDLGPLDVDEVRALARATLDAVPDERLVRTLWESTRGNPFYVEEGVRSMGAAGALVVENGRCGLSADDAASALQAPTRIVYRLFNLGPHARAVARALTAFRRFQLEDLGLLVSLTGLDEVAVERAFDTLVDGHILSREGDGYEFAHPIVRHTLYDDLGPAERRRVHARLAEHLSKARAEGRHVALADLAAHVAVSADAGDETAIAVLIEAAEAVSSTAPASAASWYARALDLLPPADERRGPLLAEQAKALFLASQLGAAVAAAAHGLDVLSTGHLRSRTAGLQVTALTALGRLDEALEQSDAMLAQSTDPLARLRAERGFLFVQLDRLDDAEAEARRALEVAADDDGALALAYRALSTIAHARGDVDRCRELFEAQLRAAERLGPPARLSALTTQAMLLALMGFVAEASAMITEAEGVRDALGGAALREPLDVAWTSVTWQAGRWDEALDRARWLAIPPRPGEAWGVLAQCAEMHILVNRGNVAAARVVARELEHARIASSTARWAEALFHQLLGEYEEAAALLEKAWHHNEACGRFADAHLLLGGLVDVALAQEKREDAKRWTAVMDDALAGLCVPALRVSRERCRAASYHDVDAARRGRALADEYGLVLESAYARLLLGELGDDPQDNLNAAYQKYRDLGAETLRRRTAHAMRAAGVPTPRRRRRSGKELTDTEITLSRLVHDGLTNREIAKVLIVSPKTVEVYLSRLFAKLGVESRVELAVAVSEGRVPTLEAAEEN
jgi:DNA-binding CsgD family transcriptional regulator/tetratricopeptide (TPR) repeat protein